MTKRSRVHVIVFYLILLAKSKLKKYSKSNKYQNLNHRFQTSRLSQARQSNLSNPLLSTSTKTRGVESYENQNRMKSRSPDMNRLKMLAMPKYKEGFNVASNQIQALRASTMNPIAFSKNSIPNELVLLYSSPKPIKYTNGYKGDKISMRLLAMRKK